MKLIKEITECVEKFHINVAVAKLYIFLNNLNEEIDKKILNEEDIINTYKKYLKQDNNTKKYLTDINFTFPIKFDEIAELLQGDNSKETLIDVI